MRRDPARAVALEAYREAPLGDRFHVRMRWLSCPFEGVAKHVPAHGRVLDLGCGHGLFSIYLAASGPARRVMGIDVDEHKLAIARRAALVHGLHVEFQSVAGESAPDDQWDAITVVDVLYLLGEEAAVRLLREAVARLAPHGVLVVKEMSLTPAWKRRVVLLQETLATRVLRITEGAQLELLEPSAIRACLEGEGLVVSEEDLGRGRPHPHHLIVGRRSAS